MCLHVYISGSTHTHTLIKPAVQAKAHDGDTNQNALQRYSCLLNWSRQTGWGERVWAIKDPTPTHSHFLSVYPTYIVDSFHFQSLFKNTSPWHFPVCTKYVSSAIPLTHDIVGKGHPWAQVRQIEVNTLPQIGEWMPCAISCFPTVPEVKVRSAVLEEYSTHICVDTLTHVSLKTGPVDLYLQIQLSQMETVGDLCYSTSYLFCLYSTVADFYWLFHCFSVSLWSTWPGTGCQMASPRSV